MSEPSSAQSAANADTGGGGLFNIPFGAFGKKYFAKKEASKARNFSARQADANRAFQERMYKNRFQYSVADMKAAGINPILAAGAGLGGGGSPTGSMANSAQASSDNIDYVQGQSSASQARSAAIRANKELALLESQKQANEADARNKNATADKTKQNERIDKPRENIMNLADEVTEDIMEAGGNLYNSAKDSLTPKTPTKRGRSNARKKRKK